jgi:hypothetical protein
VFPGWPAGLDPDADNVDAINAWIYESRHGAPWEEIHREWRERFLRLIELGEAMPEKDLMEAGKYPWIKGSALAAVLVGTYEHHEEHLEPLGELLG